MIRSLTCVVATTAALAGSTQAQSVDGLYQPSGASWSCSAEQIGMDGGALSIQNGVLDGVENRCQLTAPVGVGDGIRYTAVCSGEGTEYREPLTLTPTANGVKIERDGSTIHWERCGTPESATRGQGYASQPSNGRWTFGGGQGVYESGTRDSNGNSMAFTCNDLGENGGLYVELDGRPISGGSVTFDIDGQVYGMTAWAEGGRINTECRVCGDNYMVLWEATASGTLLTVRASDGRSAAFSLSGSSDALGDVVCRPDDGF